MFERPEYVSEARESSMLTAPVAGIHRLPAAKDTVREAEIPARAREAATDTPSSKASRSQEERAVSSTIRWWERCVSSYWRTMSLPRRAVDCQCTARRSSPGS